MKKRNAPWPQSIRRVSVCGIPYAVRGRHTAYVVDGRKGEKDNENKIGTGRNRWGCYLVCVIIRVQSASVCVRVSFVFLDAMVNVMVSLSPCMSASVCAYCVYVRMHISLCMRCNYLHVTTVAPRINAAVFFINFSLNLSMPIINRT